MRALPECSSALLAIPASLLLSACGGADPGPARCSIATSEQSAQWYTIADFEDPAIFEYTESSTGRDYRGVAALSDAVLDQIPEFGVGVGSTDPNFSWAAGYADSRISTFELAPGHESRYAFRMQYDSPKGGWGGGLYFGLEVTRTDQTGISFWLNGHGSAKVVVGGWGDNDVLLTTEGYCEVEIPTEWTRFDVRWGDLRSHEGWPADPTLYVLSIGWLVDSSFEIVVDDIYMMR